MAYSCNPSLTAAYHIFDIPRYKGGGWILLLNDAWTDLVNNSFVTNIRFTTWFILYKSFNVLFKKFHDIPDSLVMEQPQGRVREHDPMFVSSLNALFIHHAPTRRRQVPHTTPPGPMYIIGEREEGVARASNAVQLTRPVFPFFLRQRPHFTFE
jgi:hypothetical protein